MKRLISIFLLAIMALFMTDTLTELHAAAAEQSESSGVAVSVSSDKKTYAAAEDADISFTIRNPNDADLNGVSWKLQLPEDLSAFSGSLYGENLRIRAGESYEGSVSVEIAGPEPTEAVTEAAGTTTAQGTTAAQGVNAGEQATAIGLICVIAAAAALAWITRKRSSKLSGIFCVLFCAGLIAVSSPAGISAAEGAAAEIQVDHTVTIGGTEYTIALRVSVDEISEAMTELRNFMFERVYTNPKVQSEEAKAERLVDFLYDYYLHNPDRLPDEYMMLVNERGTSLERAACDYVSSMSDRYAVATFNDLFLPNSWKEM